MDIIKSISYSQEEILKNICRLYNNQEGFELDPCYSKGNFYKNDMVPQPKYKFDINPQADGVVRADCRDLPLCDESVKSIIYDPPFLATKGPSLDSNDNNNIINKRFGVYPNERELFQFYYNSLKEFDRVLAPDGLLVIKCQDKVSSNIQYLSHVKIIEYCEQIGLYCEDVFILLARNRLCAQWQIASQKRSRKFHSYFLVFRKNKSALARIEKNTKI